ncbi:unnamed protein product [Ectocarpus sp. 12 AP-2014]
MRKAGGRLAPSRSSFNICLNACRHGRQRDKVMSVLEMMVQDGIPPSGKSYSSALQACAKDGNVPDARKMLGWMWTSPDLEGGVKGLRPTTWGYNCAMEACARSGDWGSAVELMDEMRTHGLSHDAFTYGAALEACGRMGNWQKAEAIVEQMADAYTESLEVASGSGDDDTGGGVAAFAHSGKSPLSPTAVHCNALLQAYSRGKRVDKALRMLDEMLAVAPVPPSSATPPPVLSAVAAAAPEENLASSRVGLEPPPPPVTMVAAEAIETESMGLDPVEDEEEFSSGSGGRSSSTSYIGTQGLAEIDSRPQPPLDEGESSPGAKSEASPPPLPPPLGSSASANAIAKIGKEASAADGVGGEGSRDDDEDDDRSALLRWDPRLPLPRPDAVSFGTVIDGCSRARLADQAVGLLKVMGEERIGGTAPVASGGGGSEMGRSGGGGGGGGGSGDTPLLPPNVHCLTAAITACGRANRLELAMAVLRQAAVLEDAWLDEQVRLSRRQQEDDAREKSSTASPATAWEWEVEAGAAEVSPTTDRRRRQRDQSPGEDTSPVADSGTSSTAILKGRGVEADAGIAASGGRWSSVKETAMFNRGKLAGGEDAEATIDGDKSAAAGAAAAWDGSETSTAEGPLPARSSLQPAFNAAINACVKSGSHGEARLLMRDMGERGLRPGREAFNSLLVACSTSYEVRVTLNYF